MRPNLNDVAQRQKREMKNRAHLDTAKSPVASFRQERRIYPAGRTVTFLDNFSSLVAVTDSVSFAVNDSPSVLPHSPNMRWRGSTARP
jgi:hypothetical protein